MSPSARPTIAATGRPVIASDGELAPDVSGVPAGTVVGTAVGPGGAVVGVEGGLVTVTVTGPDVDAAKAAVPE